MLFGFVLVGTVSFLLKCLLILPRHVKLMLFLSLARAQLLPFQEFSLAGFSHPSIMC